MPVGDKWWLRLGDQQILWGKNDLPSRLMTIFQEEDKYMQGDWARSIDELNDVPSGQEIPPHLQPFAEWDDDDDDIDTSERFGYRTTVEVALTRLNLMGFTPETTRQSMAEIHMSGLKEDGHPEEDLLLGDAKEVIDAGLADYLKACTRYGFEGSIRLPTALDYYFEYDTEDPRFLLSALLHGQDPQKTLRMDLEELLAAGYCKSTDELTTQALDDLRSTTASTGPIIVITEGKFDARVVPRALRLVRPDIAGYFKFWDLETTRAPGGTDQVVKNLRSFAAAGVMNRVVGILDNDTAGREAAKQLDSSPLPGHYGVCVLPDLDYARSYPTLGPSGAAEDDVTGRACSIEFYFGLECLRGTDGHLIPVRWKSHIEKMSDYQGELANKSYVQARIEEMLAQAEASEQPLGEAWDPMRQLAETLVEVVARPMIA